MRPLAFRSSLLYYASHFASIWHQKSAINPYARLTPALQRSWIDISILWQGNPIHTVNTFGTPHCSLCLRERAAILHALSTDSSRLLNTRMDLYSGCRHKSRFHTFETLTSAEEAQEAEKVNTLAADMVFQSLSDDPSTRPDPLVVE